jgi:hypothetical protein
MLERGGVEREQVDEVILWQVLTVGEGPEPGGPCTDVRNLPSSIEVIPAPCAAMLRCNCRKWRFQHDIQDRDRMFA